MKKLNWRLSEVRSFLEDLIHHEEATTYEEELLQDYYWNGKFDTKCKEFKMVIHTMNKLYGGE